MNDQQVIRQFDADHFELHTAVVTTHPHKSFIEPFGRRHTLRLASIGHCGEHVELADAALPRGLRELDLLHTP